MTTVPSQLPAPIAAYLRRYQMRRGWQRVVRRMGLSLFITLLWTLGWCLLDRAVALPPAVRAILLSINLAAVIAIVGRGLIRMWMPARWIDVAQDIEHRDPSWRERLNTVTSRTLGPQRFVGSSELLAALSAQVAKEAAELDPTDLLPWPGVFRPWVASVLLLFVGLMLAWVAPSLDLPRLALRYATPLAHVAPAATTRLVVRPGDVEIPAGEGLRVRASAERLDESTLTLHTRLTTGNSPEWTEQPMSANPDGTFEARVSALERDLEYFVTGGDARSETYRAHVLARPAAIAFRWTITYPPYLNLAPLTVDNDDAVLEAPANSEIALQLTASEPLAQAFLELGNESIPMSAGERPQVRLGRFTLKQNVPVQVRMTSTSNVQGQFTGGRLRVVTDRPPVIAIDSADARSQRIKIKYQASDDFGLARLDAEVDLPDGTRRSLTIPITGDDRDQRGTFEIEAARLAALGDDMLTIQLRGEDRAGQFAQSNEIRITAGSDHRPPEARNVVQPPMATTEPTRVPDPAGFGDAISAYFDAISAPPQ